MVAFLHLADLESVLLYTCPSVCDAVGQLTCLFYFFCQLTFIQDSAKYFLEILQDNKSNLLEWFIIILIMAEIVVSVYDLATRGHKNNGEDG